MKLVHATTAPNQLTAEMWRDLLISEGIPAMLEPRDAVSFLGVSYIPCRILVPEDRLEEAREILREMQEGEAGAEAEENHRDVP